MLLPRRKEWLGVLTPPESACWSAGLWTAGRGIVDEVIVFDPSAVGESFASEADEDGVMAEAAGWPGMRIREKRLSNSDCVDCSDSEGMSELGSAGVWRALDREETDGEE
jgi:hypothetical protein